LCRARPCREMTSRRSPIRCQTEHDIRRAHGPDPRKHHQGQNMPKRRNLHSSRASRATSSRIPQVPRRCNLPAERPDLVGRLLARERRRRSDPDRRQMKPPAARARIAHTGKRMPRWVGQQATNDVPSTTRADQSPTRTTRPSWRPNFVRPQDAVTRIGATWMSLAISLFGATPQRLLPPHERPETASSTST
jgi:hypothetical protein